MPIEIRCIPAFDDNYIWLLSAAGERRITIVDPGDADPVLEAIERDGLEPAAILITHHHGDHTGGVGELVRHFAIPVYGPDDRRIRGIDRIVGEGDCVEPEDGISLRVMETPGHTRSHICYVGHGVLFSGDTLFTGGCGRLFEGTPDQMHGSLQKIASLPDETLVYCAHEYTLANLAFARVAEPDNPQLANRLVEAEAARARGAPTVPAPLGLERATNPFLRCDEPNLIAAAERFAGRRLEGGAAVFGVVRHWKDTLD